MNTVTLRRPDDWHCHLRDDQYLHRTVADTAAQFARALVMPNLKEPITSVSRALAYRERILAHLPTDKTFDPVFSLYLTAKTTQQDIEEAAKTPWIKACKLYPQHATTLSEFGIQSIEEIFPILDAMQTHGLLLLIHGETAHPEIDIFDREESFIEHELTKIIQAFPRLKIVLEHISTQHAVQFIQAQKTPIAATITAHHLLYHRNALLAGGIHPHYYCLPILKRKTDQAALIQAATSGDPRFFLGTDSAPHTQDRKENACGCAGIYTAFSAMELYAEVFEKEQALPQLENFSSVFGARFYGLPLNETKITLIKESWTMPQTLRYGNDVVVPLRAGELILWKYQHA